MSEASPHGPTRAAPNESYEDGDEVTIIEADAEA